MNLAVLHHGNCSCHYLAVHKVWDRAVAIGDTGIAVHSSHCGHCDCTVRGVRGKRLDRKTSHRDEAEGSIDLPSCHGQMTIQRGQIEVWSCMRLSRHLLLADAFEYAHCGGDTVYK